MSVFPAGPPDNLTENNLDEDREPSWVARGIAFDTIRPASASHDIYTMSSTGENQTKLFGTGFPEAHPSWSPDGTQIAYHRNPTTNQAATNIYTIFLDLTGTPAQVTTDPGQDRDPSWVASGIAFETLRPAVSDTYEIFTTSAAGGTERNLTNSAFSDNHPAWSEDGTRVAFQRRLSRPGGAQWDIVVIDVASGAEINLTTSADADECMPVWSADGSKLAFYKGAPGACDTSGASTVASDIWVMERNGGNPRQLTSNAQRNVDPAWSPDGTRIAWSSNRDGDYEIYVMQASGAGVQQFTFNNTPDMAPDWQPGSGSNSASDVRVFLPLVAAP